MIKRFEPSLARLATLAEGSAENVKIDSDVKLLVAELTNLNQRWQKADALEKAGQFIGKSQEHEQKICRELRQICGRATDIWELLNEKLPESLIGLYLLYPNHTEGEA
jgi:ribonuclease HI